MNKPDDLTLEEKADLVIGAEPWISGNVPRLGIRPLRFADGPVGVRCENPEAAAADKHNRHASYKATCFPGIALLASSFDRRAAYAAGKQIGTEAAHFGVDVLLGPGINHKRTPIGGRNFEYMSEDPVLTSEIAAAYIQGVQSCGVGCSLKHYFGNNTEFDRYNVDVVIGERALREIYLRSFERIFAKVQPFTVMAAYNRYHGQYCAQSREVLEELLRETLGFEGTVISDWGAVRDRAQALLAGCDLEMGFEYHGSKEKVLQIAGGAEGKEALDRSCARLLRLREQCSGKKGEPVDFEKGYDVALKIALGGMVLLKNEGVLPLRGDFCVIGDAAVTPRIQGEGSSRVESYRVSSPLAELQKLYGNIPFARGYKRNEPYDEQCMREACELAKKSGTALVFLDCDDYSEEESSDRATLALPEKHLRLIDGVSRCCERVVVLLQTGSVTEMPYAEKVQGIVQMYFGGEAAGEAIALLLSGKHNFSGRLAETFPIRYEDNPSYPYYAKEKGRLDYAEGIYTGYRYYDTRNVPVRFPFGYGLSYTSFAYSDMTCMVQDGGVVCRVRICNVGDMAGKETAMLFVQKPGEDVPARELVAFEKYALAPGECTDAEFFVDEEDLTVWDEKRHTRMLRKETYRFAFYDGARKLTETEVGLFNG